MRVIEATRAGGPEVLTLADRPDLIPDRGQLLVQLAAAGINFIDTYRRAGVYPMPYPHVVGAEGSGTVLAVGDGVQGFAVGDRVAWSGSVTGSYAEQVLVAAAQSLPVPDGVDDLTAAALPLQGMTAHYLARSTFPAEAGQSALVHAGAGGVGLLLTQLLAAKRITVISTVSTEDKEELSRRAGATAVIRYDRLADLTAELPALVREANGGAGVHVVYDGVGKATFDASLASLRRRGTLVLFGGASGQVPPFDLQRLNSAGSLYVTRPSLGDYIATREELLWRSGEIFAAAVAGELDVRIGATYPLAEAAEAHRALEGRATTGKVLLVP